jgi:hypothetical protein
MAPVPHPPGRQDESVGGSFFLVPVSFRERVVLAVGLFISFGTSSAFAFFASILAVGGDGSSTGVQLVGGFFVVCIAASLWLSIWLARRGWLVTSILAGFIPILVLFGVVFIVGQIMGAL